MPKLMNSHVVTFIDGRKVRIREYDDSSIRVAVDYVEGSKVYAITEAFLLKGSANHAILKLVPLKDSQELNFPYNPA